MEGMRDKEGERGTGEDWKREVEREKSCQGQRSGVTLSLEGAFHIP